MEMTSGTIVALLWCIPFVAGITANEIIWRRRLKICQRVSGVITGFHSDPESDMSLPVIAWFLDGIQQEHISNFVLVHDPVGTEVILLRNPVSGRISQYSSRSRWFFTVLSSLALAILLALALLSK